MNNQVKIAWFGKHFGEEPPLVGNKEQGAGTIFFSGCNMRCVFCQNYQISQPSFAPLSAQGFGGLGRLIGVEELAEIMLELQASGAANIDLVTPTLWWKQIREAIDLARGKGLVLPIVWNSNAFESLEIIDAMRGCVDVYLPDFKYAEDKLAQKYSDVNNYFETARAAVRRMYEQVGNLEVDERGIATRGLLVRHLVLPEAVANSTGVLNEIAQIDTMIQVSLMSQYNPVFRAAEFPEINRTVAPDEMRQVYEYAEFCGLKNGFRQEQGSARPFTPDFNRSNPFKFK